MKRFIIPLVLFAIAFGVFYLGLFVGLTQNPTIGSILWLLAAVIGIVGLIRLVTVLQSKDNK